MVAKYFPAVVLAAVKEFVRYQRRISRSPNTSGDVQAAGEAEQ